MAIPAGGVLKDVTAPSILTFATIVPRECNRSIYSGTPRACHHGPGISPYDTGFGGDDTKSGADPSFILQSVAETELFDYADARLKLSQTGDSRDLRAKEDSLRRKYGHVSCATVTKAHTTGQKLSRIRGIRGQCRKMVRGLQSVSISSYES
jgi:hypothetical protein